MNHNLPGSSASGLSQAAILEWLDIFFSKGSSWPRDRTHISCIGRQIVPEPPWKASSYPSTTWHAELPQPETERIPSTMKAQTLSHWTTMEILLAAFKAPFSLCPMFWQVDQEAWVLSPLVPGSGLQNRSSIQASPCLHEWNCAPTPGLTTRNQKASLLSIFFLKQFWTSLGGLPCSILKGTSVNNRPFPIFLMFVSHLQSPIWTTFWVRCTLTKNFSE